MTTPCTLPLHYVWIASKAGWPGAFASCVDEEPHLTDFMKRTLKAGVSMKRVTCDEAQAEMGKYLDWLDGQKKPSRVAAPRNVNDR